MSQPYFSGADQAKNQVDGLAVLFNVDCSFQGGSESCKYCVYILVWWEDDNGNWMLDKSKSVKSGKIVSCGTPKKADFFHHPSATLQLEDKVYKFEGILIRDGCVDDFDDIDTSNLPPNHCQEQIVDLRGP